MEDSLLNYYEKELTFVREMGAEFARKYPKIAGRLQLEPDKCDDPHTERLIEAFAFLSGRIHKKLEDDFPEITESIFSIIYPHYVRPIPSMSIVRFEPIKQTIPPTGYEIDKGTALYSRSVGGTACQFSTSYPVTIWPADVISADIHDPVRQIKDAQQVISLKLKTYNNLSVSKMGWEKLRFFLNGPHQHVFHLYELLFNHVCHVEMEAISAGGKKVVVPLDPDDLLSVGLGPDEAILPYSRKSFPGYILLFEYFCFPEKFLFFDLKGLERLRDRKFKDSLHIRLYLNREAKSNIVVNKDTFCTNATPAINLFSRIAEPIRVDNQKIDYHVIPDLRRQDSTEVYSVDRVTASTQSSPGKEVEYRPFYSIRHHLEDEDDQGRRVFWHTERRLSGKKGDNGSEIFLSFADLDFDPSDPDTESLTVRVTCTNRDLPMRLPMGDSGTDFSMETAAPVSRIACLTKPSPTRRPSLGGALQWRLVSHLSLNYMSIVEGGEEALREILRLYDFDNSPTTRQQINGIVTLNSRHVTKRMGQGFCRGVQVTMEFDEDKFVGTGLYLFACILERFLAQYVSVNSFSQLIARSVQRKEAIKQWPPRNGNRVLL
jgi:type VI secretion system protein ImpG